MYKKSMLIRIHLGLLVPMLFVSAILLANNNNRIGTLQALLKKSNEKSFCTTVDHLGIYALMELPKLSVKTSIVEGNNSIITFNISIINDELLKALDEIKKAHKPGNSIAFEFYVFEINKADKTLKIEMGVGQIQLKDLLKYLQGRIDYTLKIDQ